MAETVASLHQASKVFKSGDKEIVALHKTDLEVKSGELLLILGPSGSGKTTLLSLLGCVIYPTTGKVVIENKEVSKMTNTEMANVRLNHIGFVFQNFNLVAPLNAMENVMLPLTLQGKPKAEASKKAEEALEILRMANRKKSYPKHLSGGEQQRVAIARALVTKPKLILCDEPTASLDAKSVTIVMEQLRKLSDAGKALAVVSHDIRLKEFAHRIVYVYNGKLYDEPQD